MMNSDTIQPTQDMSYLEKSTYSSTYEKTMQIVDQTEQFTWEYDWYLQETAHSCSSQKK